MSSPAIVFLGFVAYAALHSALLTGAARSVLEALVGPRAFRGVFRLAFTVQAVLLLVGYVVIVARLPDWEWVRVTGFGAVLLWGVRLVGLGFIVRCVGRFGAAEFLGWSQFRAWWRGEPVSGDGVETGELVVSGPYRHVRHPMYSAGLVVLWADPHWSANGFAFSLAASLYLWLGALHEERRLLKFYGQAYFDYMEHTPRFLPGLRVQS